MMYTTYGSLKGIVATLDIVPTPELLARLKELVDQTEYSISRINSEYNQEYHKACMNETSAEDRCIE